MSPAPLFMLNPLVPLRARLRLKRRREGYSLRSLARVLGLSCAALARLERGEGAVDAHTRLRLEAWLDPTAPPSACACVKCTGMHPQQGWQCPECARCYAPTVTECLSCNIQKG